MIFEMRVSFFGGGERELGNLASMGQWVPLFLGKRLLMGKCGCA